jgi:hypothetical protein
VVRHRCSASAIQQPETFDALCPRKASVLRERMREERVA